MRSFFSLDFCQLNVRSVACSDKIVMITDL